MTEATLSPSAQIVKHSGVSFHSFPSPKLTRTPTQNPNHFTRHAHSLLLYFPFFHICLRDLCFPISRASSIDFSGSVGYRNIHFGL